MPHFPQFAGHRNYTVPGRKHTALRCHSALPHWHPVPPVLLPGSLHWNQFLSGLYSVFSLLPLTASDLFPVPVPLPLSQLSRQQEYSPVPESESIRHQSVPDLLLSVPDQHSARFLSAKAGKVHPRLLQARFPTHFCSLQAAAADSQSALHLPESAGLPPPPVLPVQTPELPEYLFPPGKHPDFPVLLCNLRVLSQAGSAAPSAELLHFPKHLFHPEAGLLLLIPGKVHL